ncbi:MAG TPA: cytochrome c [Polyangiales bacterium]|jgi:nitric oxide reductase subunit C|nr:cytochrome c [Polyangiales bacterium]
MNKRQTRLFAIGATGLSALVFLGLTIDTHRQIGALTNAENITPAVSRGDDVWHANNCINCHTLFGEGAYYAPDLTKITQLRGTAYLSAFLQDPSKFYNEQKHRRLMPKIKLSTQEISDVIAFLDWVSKVDNQGWPPRPILVSGTSIPGMDLTNTQRDQAAEGHIGPAPGARPVAQDDDPVARGQAYFNTVTPPCNACHSIAPKVNLVGPSLAGVASRAEKLLKSSTYKGSAKDAMSYIKESILHPNAYIVPEPMYSANGVSFMPDTYKGALTPEQVESIAEFLASLKDPSQ